MAKKKQTKQVRISLKHYEQIGRLAFRAHKPMTAVLEELISNRHEPMRSPHKRREEAAIEAKREIETRKCIHGLKRSFDYRFAPKVPTLF
jgi:hypothetical protein